MTDLSRDLPIRSECRPTVTEELGQESWAIASELQRTGFGGHTIRTMATAESPPRIIREVSCRLPIAQVSYCQPRPGTLILIFAGAGDTGAQEIARGLERRGVDVIVKDAFDSTLSLRVLADPTGDAEVEIRDLESGTGVGCILNRGGFRAVADNLGEAPFIANERLAAWWAALALFAGPVLNRPNRYGFLPVLEIPTLVRAIEGLKSSSYWAECGGATNDSTSSDDAATLCVNTHRVDSDQWVPPKDRANLAETRAIVRVTQFDSTQVFRLFVIGDEHFIDRSDLAPSHLEVVARLSAALSDGNMFCSLVLQASSQGTFLLAVDRFPNVSRYPHLSDRIHDSLAMRLNRRFA